MKEKYEYLIDEYDVELVVNADYAAKNNLHSIKLVKEHLENAYIIPRYGAIKILFIDMSCILGIWSVIS